MTRRNAESPSFAPRIEMQGGCVARTVVDATRQLVIAFAPVRQDLSNSGLPVNTSPLIRGRGLSGFFYFVLAAYWGFFGAAKGTHHGGNEAFELGGH